VSLHNNWYSLFNEYPAGPNVRNRVFLKNPCDLALNSPLEKGTIKRKRRKLRIPYAFFLSISTPTMAIAMIMAIAAATIVMVGRRVLESRASVTFRALDRPTMQSPQMNSSTRSFQRTPRKQRTSLEPLDSMLSRSVPPSRL